MNRGLAILAFLLMNKVKKKAKTRVFTVLIKFLIPRSRLLIIMNIVKARRLYLLIICNIFVEYVLSTIP